MFGGDLQYFGPTAAKNRRSPPTPAWPCATGNMAALYKSPLRGSETLRPAGGIRRCDRLSHLPTHSARCIQATDGGASVARIVPEKLIHQGGLSLISHRTESVTAENRVVGRTGDPVAVLEGGQHNLPGLRVLMEPLISREKPAI